MSSIFFYIYIFSLFTKYVKFTIICIKLFFLMKLNLHQNVKKGIFIIKVLSEFLSKKSCCDKDIFGIEKTYEKA